MSEVTAVPLRPVARGTLARLWLGIGLAVVIGIGAAIWATSAQVAMAEPPATFLAGNAKRPGVVTTPIGMQYQVLKAGSGPMATRGDVVKVNYTGKLANGVTFDSNAAAGEPVTFPVAQVIPGFSEGLTHMNRGAKLRMWIPPELGYQAKDQVDPRSGKVVIPANSLLIFDVELVDLAALPQMAAPGLSPEAMPQGDVPSGDMPR